MVFLQSCVITPASHFNMRNRKQKNMLSFCIKKWSWSFLKFHWFSLAREFVKQYLSEEQNDYLQSGYLPEVVAYEKSGRYERVDGNIILINSTHIMMSHF